MIFTGDRNILLHFGREVYVGLAATNYRALSSLINNEDEATKNELR